MVSSNTLLFLHAIDFVWLKIGMSFTNKNGKDMKPIAIDGRKLRSNTLPEVNTRVSYSYALKNV